MMRLLRLVWLSLFWSVFCTLAQAHEMTLSELTIKEYAPNEFIWSWGAPGKNRPIADDLSVKFPAHCKVDLRTLSCPEKGLSGEISIRGLGENYSATLLRVSSLGMEQRVFTLTSIQPHVTLTVSGRDERSASQIASAYTVLGIQHILGGIDHLLFVITLLFLVGFQRRLFWTVTAFTLAHSITLALSALGLLVLRPAPVEACIALSIVLVASEALSKSQTWTKQLPAFVALLFGLVHGLGFAGALKEIGLPENHLGFSLLGFNLGVEIGQIGVIALAWLAFRLTRSFQVIDKLRRTALYAIGSLATFWTMTRVVQIFS
jgi:HupE / UreJ protein